MTKPSGAMRWFVDTNVLIYSREQHDPWKWVRAQEWLETMLEIGQPIVSPQILNETCSVLLKGAKTPAAVRDVHNFVHQYVSWCDAPLDVETVIDAMAIHAEHHVSWWDCVLVASALQADADYLLTEDLQDGRRFGRLQIVDPFRIAPEEFLAALA